ncbi:MAG: YlbF family regulator [Desulfitobacteriaceae bacterium]|nr:YlbF family regulator [Desulfitobacteriaceae bacterium]MDI6914356.1 YlbF family regulator [Desulfitobacteriaceae bacterium]
MNVEIYDKAQILADAIAASEELAALRETEQAMLADDQAQQIIAEFQEVQNRIRGLQQQGQTLSEADQKAVSTMEESVESHPLIFAYLQAQDKFTEMLDSVNSVLANAIAYGEEASGDGCSTCGSDGCSTCHTQF